jgi:glycosyltransferase involved in cell wall biosynthesis
VTEFFKNRPPGPEKVIDISIIVPVFNEADALIEVCQGVRRELTQIGITWELIFVDDGSTDSTDAILDHLAEEDQRVRVIHFKRNMGQTAAMMAGFDHARGEVIIPLDGDGQNDPGDIPKMLEVLDQGYDVVSGWRKDRQDNYIQRNVPSILANKLISLVSGVPLHDFGCSLKAYKRHVVEGIRLYGEMHRFLARCQDQRSGRQPSPAPNRQFKVRIGTSGQGASRLAGREISGSRCGKTDVRLWRLRDPRSGQSTKIHVTVTRRAGRREFHQRTRQDGEMVS